MRTKLGLYLHIPFCGSKCPYCDFTSGCYDVSERLAYLDALEAEIRLSPWRGTPAGTLYLGGGTPSELTINELRRLVSALRDTFELQPAEWTLESNPGSVGQAWLEAAREVGFNRISLGFQSLKDRLLLGLGRTHTAALAREGYANARAAGFQNINLDLIFGIPGQTLQDWKSDLEQVLALEPEHLSLYSLTIEPSTEYGRRYAEGRLVVPDEDAAADMFETAMDLTQAAGYHHYEISNYARPGKECAHNLVYWRHEPYLGFGCSAASFMDGVRWTNAPDIRRYSEEALSGSVTRQGEEKLDAQASLAEAVMLRLRTSDGVDLEELGCRFNLDATALFKGTVPFLIGSQLVVQQGDGRILLTRRGKLLADSVCAQFLKDARTRGCAE
jgi:oxygen-independent coproporphyrinogen III oxidase